MYVLAFYFTDVFLYNIFVFLYIFITYIYFLLILTKLTQKAFIIRTDIKFHLRDFHQYTLTQRVEALETNNQ